MKAILKTLLKAVLPHGLVAFHRRRRALLARLNEESARAQYHAARRQKIAATETCGPCDPLLNADNYEEIVGFLRDRGLPENHIREGSVPPESLEFIREHVVKQWDGTRPLRALHIGNFVGVSLASLTAALVRLHPESLMVSVDPNLPHRGIHQPQSHVLALLSASGLQSNSLVLAGYSGKKSVSNDATVFDGYDPAAEFAKETATENVLGNLARICPGTFDLVFLDGNHDAAYLLGELQTLRPLLRPGGYVVLDDVDAAWAEIRAVFERIGDLGLESVAADGRVGIARLKPLDQKPGPLLP